MSTQCKIEIYSEAIEASLADLEGTPLDVFYALAIVNPFGPTLNFVAAVGDPQIGRAQTLVKVMLNPFSQTVEQVGRFWPGDTWNPVNDLEPLIALNYGSCPTLVLVSNRVEEGTRKQLTAQIFARFRGEVGRVWRSVDRHLGDPWTRVSESMANTNDNDVELDLADAAMHLANAVENEKHVMPEIQALFFAWRGSIEQTGISGHLRETAFGFEEFKRFFIERILPSIWMPDLEDPSTEEPTAKRPERLKVDSLEDVNRILSTDDWKNFDEDKLVDLLRALFLCYGAAGETSFVPKIATVYQHAISIGFDSDTRLLLETEAVELVESDKVFPVVFLPFLVLDDDLAITTKAAIDYVSSSDYVDGTLSAFGELRNLFSDSTLANRGAAFGALVAMGDSEVLDFVKELAPLLTTEEVRQAARVHTQFPQHLAIQFWLGWAKRLVKSDNEDDQRDFGSCASALILVLDNDRVGKVSEGKRNFPCQKSSRPITIEHEWTLEQYADLLAPELYEIEAMESAPCLFSDVLRAWGLKPRAPTKDQFIPEADRDKGKFRRLRDPLKNSEDAKKTQSLMNMLFGRKN